MPRLQVHPCREYHEHQIQVFLGSILNWRKRFKNHAYKDPSVSTCGLWKVEKGGKRWKWADLARKSGLNIFAICFKDGEEDMMKSASCFNKKFHEKY